MLSPPPCLSCTCALPPAISPRRPPVLFPYRHRRCLLGKRRLYFFFFLQPQTLKKRHNRGELSTGLHRVKCGFTSDGHSSEAATAPAPRRAGEMHDQSGKAAPGSPAEPRASTGQVGAEVCCSQQNTRSVPV